MQYTKVQINNNIRRLLEEGKSNEDALDFFLKMNMMNDLGPERPFVTKVPSPAEVRINLLGNKRYQTPHPETGSQTVACLHALRGDGP